MGIVCVCVCVGEGRCSRKSSFYCTAKEMDLKKISLDEATFRWMLNEDAMATEKLAEGIRKFAADGIKLEEIVRAKLSA